MNIEEFCKSCELINAAIFRLCGFEKSYQALYQWGVRGGESVEERNRLVDDYVSFINE